MIYQDEGQSMPFLFNITDVFQDMSNEDYHSRDEYSSSFIKTVSYHSVGKAISKKENFEENEALINGSVFHDLMELGYIPDKYVVKPDGLSLATKEGKAWKLANEGNTIISVDFANKAPQMRDSVLRLDFIKKLLDNPKYELRHEWSFIAEGDDSVTEGLRFRIRPDLHLYNTETDNVDYLVDWKTTNDLDKLLRWGFKDLGYDIQGVFYSDVLGVPPSRFLFVCVEKDFPFSARVVMMSEETIDFGRDKFKRAVHRIKDYESSGIIDIPMPEVIYV